MMNLLTTNWYSVFYWLSVLDNVNEFLVVFVLFSIMSSVILGVFIGIRYMDDEPVGKAKHYLKVSLMLTLFTSVLLVFTPNKSQMIFIIAGGAASEFITSDSSSRALPADLTKYLHTYLQKEIATLDEDIKEQLKDVK